MLQPLTRVRARFRPASRRCACQQQPIVGLVVVSPRSWSARASLSSPRFSSLSGAARPDPPPAKRRNVGRAPLEIVVVLPPLSRFGGKATRTSGVVGEDANRGVTGATNWWRRRIAICLYACGGGGAIRRPGCESREGGTTRAEEICSSISALPCFETCLNRLKSATPSCQA